MREPATALTDFLLAIVATLFLLRLWRPTHEQRLFGARLFFAGFAAASICGGTWHGFFSDPASASPGALWWLTLVGGAVTASGLAVVGLECMGHYSPRVLLGGSLLFVIAFGLYAWWDRRFLVTVVANGTATVPCLVGLLDHARRHRRRGAALAAAALVLAVFAAVLQQLGIAIHPVHFDHNATYHLCLLPALWLFQAGVRRLAADHAP